MFISVTAQKGKTFPPTAPRYSSMHAILRWSTVPHKKNSYFPSASVNNEGNQQRTGCPGPRQCRAGYTCSLQAKHGWSFRQLLPVMI